MNGKYIYEKKNVHQKSVFSPLEHIQNSDRNWIEFAYKIDG